MLACQEPGRRPGFFLLRTGRKAARASDRETRTAAARCRGVGILDPERLADEIVDEIDLRTPHIDDGDGIDHNGGAVLLDHEIVVIAAFIEGERILETRTPAAIDGNSQVVLPWLGMEDFADAPGGI